MANFINYMRIKYISMLSLLALLNACAPNLSNEIYEADAGLNLVLQGEVISLRPVKVKSSSASSTGALGGAAMGAAAGANAGRGTGKVAAAVGVGIAGAMIGAAVTNKLSEANAIEYIIKVDTSALQGKPYGMSAAVRNALSTAISGGMLAVIQAPTPPLHENQQVNVIFSANTVRAIAAQASSNNGK